MYFSIIDDKRYWVVLRDGVTEKFIMEFPFETLADEVAFQLQMAWNDGESWGKRELRKTLDPKGYQLEISRAINDFINRAQKEQDQHKNEMEEKSRTYEMKVRQQVLRLKN